MYILFIIILGALGIYSYALIDPNLTLINASWWTPVRDPLVYFGYYQRELSTAVYIALLIILFIFHNYCIRTYKKVPMWLLYVAVPGLLWLSYPFLSHDFFNYLFDAKILTFYGQNPYLHAPMEFQGDEWLRFMHWVHRTYPYGPTFLPITLIPSLLSFGKLILNFILFKGLFIAAYSVSVSYLYKLNKQWAVLFATHPLVLIEGLMNGHNDLLGTAWGIAGVYYLLSGRRILPRVLMLVSFGIKYMSAPILFLSKNKESAVSRILFLMQIGIILLAGYYQEIQPWYFLSLFVFIPFFPQVIHQWQLFFFGLLLSYYPYVRFGGWDTVEKMDLKHQIIIIFFLLNSGILMGKILYKTYALRTKHHCASSQLDGKK